MTTSDVLLGSQVRLTRYRSRWERRKARGPDSTRPASLQFLEQHWTDQQQAAGRQTPRRAAGPCRAGRSVAVVVRLVRAVDVDADVLGLLLGQLGQLAAQCFDVDAGHLLVEVLGQPVDLVVVLVVLGPQLDLRDDLVGEAVAHHERRVSGGVAQVQQPALGQHDDRLAGVPEGPQVDLRADVDLGGTGLLQPGDLDLVVEVADVAQDRLVLHRLHVLERDDVLVAGGGDDDVGLADHVLDPLDVVALHQRLQRVDRVDLGDGHPRALAGQRVHRALADVAVAADQHASCRRSARRCRG